MPKKPNDPNAATREILTAIVKGTRKLPARVFTWELGRELRKYKPSRREDFLAWLRKAGIRNAPTPQQCTAAAKMARQEQASVLFPHPLPAAGDY
jgi:hypothetical protein